MLRFYFFAALSLLPVLARAQESGSSGGVIAALSKAIDTVVNYIKAFFGAITDFIVWVGKFVVEIFKALWDIARDLVVWVFDSLFKLAASIIDGVADAFDIENMARTFMGYWELIPPEVAQIMQAIGVSTAFGIVVTGLIIRFALQLIPFIRLGS